MDPVTSTAIVAGVEVVKMLIMLAAQQAEKNGLTKEQVDQMVKEELTKVYQNDPSLIPDPAE